MPAPPLQLADTTQPSLDLSELSQTINTRENLKQQAYDWTREIQTLLSKAKLDPTGAQHFPAILQAWQSPPDAALTVTQTRSPRVGNIAHRLEETIRFQAFQNFLETAQLLQPSQVALPVTDEEYLAAVMGLLHDLRRYSIGRATVRDETSVQAARNLAQGLHEQLLALDFRNGPLRRQFDSTKYAVRSMETLLYELAVTSGEEPPTKKTKPDAVDFPTDEIQELGVRFAHYDELREQIIKKARDGQKAAKQGIYALQRGDKAKATTLLQACRDNITKDLEPIVEQDASLRNGSSMSGVLEEYIEGALFQAWLGDANSTPTGIILPPSHFDDLHATPEEYLGGLCDLTGEVGRYAVQRGTERDHASVRACLETNATILSLIEGMRMNNKKVGAVRQSVEKLERMLYEMSLSEAAGGRQVQSEAADAVVAAAED